MGFLDPVLQDTQKGYTLQSLIYLDKNGPYDLDLKKGVDFGLKNSVYLDLNSFTVSNFDLKPKLCQQCT